MTRSVEFFSRTVDTRMCVRVPIRIPVSIEFRPLSLRARLRAVSHNISFDGALIEVSHSNVPKGTLLRVLFETAPKVHLIMYAVVVRSTDHYLALMFTTIGDDVLEYLSAILAAEFNKFIDGQTGSRSMANVVQFAESGGLRK